MRKRLKISLKLGKFAYYIEIWFESDPFGSYSFRPLLGPLDGLLHGENIKKETLYNEKNGCLYNLYLIFLWNLPGKLKVSQEPRECVWKKRLFGTFQTFV